MAGARGAFAVANYLWSATTPITATPFSVAMRVYALDASSGTLFVIADTATATEYFSCYSVNGAVARLYTRNGATSVYAEKAFTKLQWEDIIFISEASNHRIVYVNGVAGAAETTNVVPAGLDAMSLGVKKVDTVSLPVAAYVGDLGVWTRALTADERAAYHGGLEAAAIGRADLACALRCCATTGGEPDVTGAYDFTEVGTVPTQTGPPVRRTLSLANRAAQMVGVAPGRWR